jgi:biotin carboxyl carrier protein
MPTLPTAIPNPSLPLPDPGDKLTFSARKLEDLRWSREVAVPGIIAAATVSYNNAVESNAAAAAATSNGTAQVVLATAQASAAAASAASALGAPGTNATSTTSTLVGTGSKTITIQTGKAYSLGQSVIIARTSDPSGVRMGGAITAYNSGTGSLTVNVSIAVGSGTFTDWTISLGVIANSGILPPVAITSGGSLTATVNINYLMDANNIVLGAPTTKAVGDLWQGQIMGSASGCSLDFGSDLAFKRTPGIMAITSQNFRFKFQWTGATYGWVNA